MRLFDLIPRETIFKILYYTGVTGLLAYLNRKQCAILMYHSITKNRYRNGKDINAEKHIHVDLFKKQVEFLSKRYSMIPLSELIRTLKENESSPEYCVALTFDDGLKNNYHNAYPILKSLNAPATIFLTTNFIGDDGAVLWTDLLGKVVEQTGAKEIKIGIDGREKTFPLRRVEEKRDFYVHISKYLKKVEDSEKNRLLNLILSQLNVEIHKAGDDCAPLSWEQVREMKLNGISFGAHGSGHVILTRIPPEEARENLRQSKSKIQEETGEVITLFAYPNGGPGDFDMNTRKILMEEDFSCALTTIQGTVTTGSDPYELKRISVKNFEGPYELYASIAGLKQVVRSLLTSFT